ncbi:MAG: rhomboid family intramembrane serine protease [Candidatus Hatepunaea meridiana]|nr:rhomboid family intramembrane serine protease [Candidatus Hatepunaea meridiana]
MIIPYRDETPSFKFPYLTLTLISVNVILYFFTFFKLEGIDSVTANLGFLPRKIIEQPYTIITSIFLHANLLHLISNMWFLWLFGDNIEDRYGRIQFLLIFLLAGIIGNFTHALFTFWRVEIPLIGASGAVAGIMGSYLVRFPKARIRCVFILIFYPIFFRLRAYWFIGIWIMWEFIAAYTTPNDNIAHWAHIGGFAFGFIWAYGRKGK